MMFRGRPGGRLGSSRPRQTFGGHRRDNSRETNSNPCSFSSVYVCVRVMLSWQSKNDGFGGGGRGRRYI